MPGRVRWHYSVSETPQFSFWKLRRSCITRHLTMTMMPGHKIWTLLLLIPFTGCGLSAGGKVLTERKDEEMVSPPHGFRVEGVENPEGLRYWLVDSVNGQTKRIALPTLPHIEKSTCPGPEFRVSPAGDWIIADEKLYRGANEIWLLHRDSPSGYSLVFPSFSRAAFSFYSKFSGSPFHLDTRYITRVGPWPAAGSKIRITLFGESSFPDERPVDVALCFDLGTQAFSISKDQKTQYF